METSTVCMRLTRAPLAAVCTELWRRTHSTPSTVRLNVCFLKILQTFPSYFIRLKTVLNRLKTLSLFCRFVSRFTLVAVKIIIFPAQWTILHFVRRACGILTFNQVRCELFFKILSLNLFKRTLLSSNRPTRPRHNSLVCIHIYHNGFELMKLHARYFEFLMTLF